MKKITLSLMIAIIATAGIFAQTPQAFKYQAVARDAQGAPVIDQNISVKISILIESPEGIVVYSELHLTTTNSMGLFALEIGNPTEVLYGNFADIDWGASEYFLKVEADMTGGTDFELLGTSQLISVPYSLYSEKAGNVVYSDTSATNELQTLTQEETYVTLSDGGGVLSVADDDNDPTNELQVVSRSNDTIYLSNGGYFIDEVDDADADPVNELQAVTMEDYTVTLSQDGGSFLTGTKSYTQAEIDVMIPYNGLTVHNSTTNCINYYYLNNWFEACGTCTPMPSQAMVGPDQTFYDNTISTALEANTTEQGTGNWAVALGTGGSFEDTANPTTVFTGEPCTYYTLAWTISNSCGSTNDSVDITFFATPTVAYAGNDTIVEGTTLVLSANTPEIGNGLWSVLSGEGGSFADATVPTTLFTGLPEITYTLQWEIATACDTTYDEVTVAFYTWQCNSPFTDIRDGQTYETVQIGEQCWMAENLNIGTMINSGSQTNNGEIEKYCYNNDPANCNVYGGLYQWNEMMQYTTTQGVQGICPEGWHLPTDAEWCTLEQEVDTTITCSSTGWRGIDGGTKLKQGGSSGFEALFAGNRDADGSFNNLGSFAYFWSSSEYSGLYAWRRTLYVSTATVYRYDTNKSSGFSVRCIKDY